MMGELQVGDHKQVIPATHTILTGGTLEPSNTKGNFRQRRIEANRISMAAIPAGSRAAELASRTPAPSDPLISISFEVRRSHSPALRSAVDELSSIVGARLEGAHRFAKEQALTDAALCLGSLRAAVNRAIPKGDPNYV